MIGCLLALKMNEAVRQEICDWRWPDKSDKAAWGDAEKGTIVEIAALGAASHFLTQKREAASKHRLVPTLIEYRGFQKDLPSRLWKKLRKDKS